MHSFPLLYSRTSRGQVQTWQIFVKGNHYYTTEGLQNGALTTSSPTICKGKNVGKKNETSDEEQAEMEAEAKFTKKVESGYCENIKDIDSPKFFEPQLAKKYDDYKDEISYPVNCQPKYDGTRLIVSKDGMFSRTGKPVVSCPHIGKILEPVFKKYPNILTDGEIYSHALKNDFNEIMSLARQSKPTQEDLDKSEAALEYWVYDCFDKNNPDMLFRDRFVLLNKILHNLSDKIKIVPTALIKDKKELDKFYEEYLTDGYEGQMIRLNTKYENKRTKSLLKRKEFIDAEYELVNLEEGKGGRANMATIATLKLKDGREFSAGVIGDFQYAENLLKNKKKYIGKPATIVYFNLTPDGIPRFGKLKDMRIGE